MQCCSRLGSRGLTRLHGCGLRLGYERVLQQGASLGVRERADLAVKVQSFPFRAMRAVLFLLLRLESSFPQSNESSPVFTAHRWESSRGTKAVPCTWQPPQMARLSFQQVRPCDPCSLLPLWVASLAYKHTCLCVEDQRLFLAKY